MENRVRMLEAQQLQLLESVTVLQREVRRLDDTDNAPHPKRARTEPNPLQELAEQLDQPHPDTTAELPSCADIGRMGQGALRDLWTQLPLGPLRKNASVMTMRRTIKEHIRAHTA